MKRVKKTKTDKMLEKALAIQRSGDFKGADAFLKQIVKLDPGNFVCLYSLGVSATQRKDMQKALTYFDKAASIVPGFAPTWFNRGIVLHKLDKKAEALESYDRALSLDSSYGEAIINRAALVAEMSNVVQAQPASQALDHDGKVLKGLVLQQNGSLAEAEEVFLDILAERPHDFSALYSMGIIAHQQGRPLKALEYLDLAARLKPDYAPTWYNRGIVLNSMKRNDAALANYDIALNLIPTYSEALVNRGAVLQEMNRHVEALETYDRLLKAHPDNDKAICNKGILLTEFKRVAEAAETFERLLQVNPDYDYGMGLLCFAQLHACNWQGVARYTAAIADGIARGKRVSKTLAVLAVNDSPEAHLTCSKIFAEGMYPAQPSIWRGEVYGHRKIRIAYVSPDFREHPVGHLTAGIFENHDKTRFETIGISLGIDDGSKLRSRISSAFDQFIDVRQKTTLEIAQLMRALEVDIAVDLAGYTADSRTGIFAHRPAPVQVNYLGYPSTLGVEYIDYLIGDRHIIPEEDQPHFTEKIVYLPDTYLPTDATLKVAERTPTRAECGLPETGFVFCSFNHAFKLNPTIFDVWMNILKRTPGSVLWLMKLNSAAEGNLRSEAQARGVDPDRLIFATRVPLVEDHLARYRVADIFLDTLPYNAHTTASDALFVGLPVLTCRGNAFPGRVATGLLHAIGMPELVTGSLKEYEELAVRLAYDEEALRSIKLKLLVNKSSYPLFDTTQFCRHLESAFVGMWERQQAGKAPESFSV